MQYLDRKEIEAHCANFALDAELVSRSSTGQSRPALQISIPVNRSKAEKANSMKPSGVGESLNTYIAKDNDLFSSTKPPASNGPRPR
jgi:hypothetical protein